MKYIYSLLVFIILSPASFAAELKPLISGIDPNDVEGEGYIDPYDADGIGHTGQSLDFIDPYDQPQITPPPQKKSVFPRLKKALVIDSQDYWQGWKKRYIESPKPPLKWPQVGAELGAGYVGAFGGSILGLFSGFLVGSLYDGLSRCERCWVDVAINMATLGASLGATAGVYMLGSDDRQQGSISATYVGTILPIIVANVVSRDSRRLNKSGFYLTTMPLLATLGFNLTRHYRRKGDKPLFENIFIDDMWVSKTTDEVFALNVRLKF